ncbi:MAG: hypothetical protein HYY76_03135 [Acidobacteria bacterium]|nr:hypothetical protein [Acidobacteriota bacterium]
MLDGIVANHMSSGAAAASVQQHGSAADAAWSLLRAARALAEPVDDSGTVNRII